MKLLFIRALSLLIVLLYLPSCAPRKADSPQTDKPGLMRTGFAYPIKSLSISPIVSQGGSGAIIIEVANNDYQVLSVIVNRDIKFHPYPIQNSFLYFSFFTWPLYYSKFKLDVLIKAPGNLILTNSIETSTTNHQYRVSRIPIRDNFTGGKKEELNIKNNKAKSALEKYKAIMDRFAEKKVLSVSEVTARILPAPNPLTNFFKSFKPLKHSAETSPFGEHRYFTLKHKTVRESYHLGVDLADEINTPIYSSNPGQVIFSGYNGANGNMILIHYGFGLYGLYAHCSELKVIEGAVVSNNQLIGTTGKTGYALGDHLHFSMIIQGNYVSPNEWMNQNWINNSINSVLSTYKLSF